MVRAVLGWHDVTGSELAAILGISQSAASRKLAGERGFTPDELDIVARHFGLDPGLLLRPEPLAKLLEGFDLGSPEPACVTEAEPTLAAA